MNGYDPVQGEEAPAGRGTRRKHAKPVTDVYRDTASNLGDSATIMEAQATSRKENVMEEVAEDAAREVKYCPFLDPHYRGPFGGPPRAIGAPAAPCIEDKCGIWNANHVRCGFSFR